MPAFHAGDLGSSPSGLIFFGVYMTEVEAVNEMLAACNESPISSLDGALPSIASRARSCLSRVSRQVQLTGWTFNTDRNVTLSRDGDDQIPLASNVLTVEVDTKSITQTDPVLLDGKMWDRWNQTYVFSADLTAFKIVYFRSWSLLPFAAQNYITRRAARLFQDEIYGASDLRASASKEELEALSQLRRAHSRERRPNMITNDSTWNIIGGGRGVS